MATARYPQSLLLVIDDTRSNKDLLRCSLWKWIPTYLNGVIQPGTTTVAPLALSEWPDHLKTEGSHTISHHATLDVMRGVGVFGWNENNAQWGTAPR